MGSPSATWRISGWRRCGSINLRPRFCSSAPNRTSEAKMVTEAATAAREAKRWVPTPHVLLIGFDHLEKANEDWKLWLGSDVVRNGCGHCPLVELPTFKSTLSNDMISGPKVTPDWDIFFRIKLAKWYKDYELQKLTICWSGYNNRCYEKVALRKISRLVQREGLDDYVETSALNGVEDVDKVFKAAIRVAIGSNTVATGEDAGRNVTTHTHLSKLRRCLCLE